MRRRGSPLLLISIVVALFIVLAVVSKNIAPMGDAHGGDEGGGGAPPPAPQQTAKSPGEVMRDINASNKQKPVVPPAPPKGAPAPQKPDRYEDGGSNWWSDKTSPKSTGH